MNINCRNGFAKQQILSRNTMRILFVTRGFPSDKDPMSGNFEAVQAKAIAQKGHDVAIMAIHWQNLLHVFGNKKIKHRIVDGIHIYESNRIKLSIPHVHFPQIEQWARKRQFKKVFDKYVQECGMPDVVHAHIIFWAAPAVIVKEKYHLPFVITEHWTKMNTSQIHRRFENQAFVYKCADKVICVSEILAESLKNKFQLESLVIHNMVSDQFFGSRKIEHNDNSFKFIGVGALRKNKRFDILVEAFALAHFPENISLDIVGEGEERKLIESKIRQYHLDKQVKMLGVKTPKEVNDLLCQSDCFVLSSRLETFAIVLIEAMAKGLPVIATRSGGPEAFVRQEDGMLVPKEDIEELSKAMKYMIEHYQDYNIEDIRNHCHDNFSQGVIAEQIIDVYNQVLAKE